MVLSNEDDTFDEGSYGIDTLVEGTLEVSVGELDTTRRPERGLDTDTYVTDVEGPDVETTIVVVVGPADDTTIEDIRYPETETETDVVDDYLVTEVTDVLRVN